MKQMNDDDKVKILIWLAVAGMLSLYALYFFVSVFGN
jgi:hypothetical protein